VCELCPPTVYGLGFANKPKSPQLGGKLAPSNCNVRAWCFWVAAVLPIDAQYNRHSEVGYCPIMSQGRQPAVLGNQIRWYETLCAASI